MRRCIVAALLILTVTAPVLLAQGNPIVEIQQRMVERVTYYFNEIETICKERVSTEAQMSLNDTQTLINCMLERYREAHTAWGNLNEEMVDAILRFSLTAVDEYVPLETTTAEQRQDQVNYLGSAYNSVTNWYKRLGTTINDLQAVGMFTRERQEEMIALLNESLQKVMQTGQDGVNSLSKGGEMTPEEVRDVLTATLEGMFEPAREDIKEMEEALFEARVEYERRFENELKEGRQTAEQLSNYADVAKSYSSILDNSFKILRMHSWTIFADLRPEEMKQQDNQ